ncbi:hypothetical protein AB0C04_26630 [Micromonospora sp. NPDC048909]|uniref:hypothetical protein n=1 Tax=Micromonospora sp. NPDC048909 TaxID=3155643 RepID=UPI0033D5A830
MSARNASRRFGPRTLSLMVGLAVTGAVVVAPAAPASAAVPGLVRVAATSVSSSTDFRSVTATCPVGKVLTGAGYELNGVTGEAVVDDFRPNGGPAIAPSSATAGAYEEDAFAGNWSNTAYAICATA